MVFLAFPLIITKTPEQNISDLQRVNNNRGFGKGGQIWEYD